jgi:hypothetical protein
MRYWLAVLVVVVAGCSRTVQSGPKPGVYWKEVGSSTCMEMPFGKAICWGDAKLLMPTWSDEAGDVVIRDASEPCVMAGSDKPRVFRNFNCYTI